MKTLTRAFAASCWLALALASGCGRQEPFELIKCSGKITYEDGTLLPAEGIVRLTFLPMALPVNAKTHPRPGVTDVNLKDGTFNLITSHKWGDGLTAGKHKVVISTDIRQATPKGVPTEYNDPEKTPLMVDTAQQPFVLKVRKPS